MVLSKAKENLLAEAFGGGSMLDGKADVGNAPNQVYSYLGYRDPRAFECIRAFISFVVNYDTLPAAANHGTN